MNCEIPLPQQAYTLASPFPEAALATFWRWYQENAGAMVDDSAPKTMDELAEKNRRDLDAGAVTFAVMHGGSPVGAVWVEKTPEAYLGHLVFERDVLAPAEKLAATRDALRAMRERGVENVLWLLYPENRPFHIFLRKLKAKEVGRLPGATTHQGQARDLLTMVSVLKDIP